MLFVFLKPLFTYKYGTGGRFARVSAIPFLIKRPYRLIAYKTTVNILISSTPMITAKS